MQHAVKIGKWGLAKGEKRWTEAEPGEGGGKVFPSVFVLSLGTLFFPSIAKSVVKSLC